MAAITAQAFWNSPIGQLLAQAFSGGQTATGRTPVDAPATGPQQAPGPQQNSMAETVNALMGTQLQQQQANLGFLRERPNTSTPENPGAKPYHGLNELYKMNPQLGGLIIDENGASLSGGGEASARPSAEARFNQGVWGNPNGRTIAPPAQGTQIVNGKPVEMSGAEIFQQMSQTNQQPAIPLNMTPGLRGGATTGGVPQGPSTTTVNGLQVPMQSFLQGANNLQPGQPSTSYQMGLGNDAIAALMANAGFGKTGGQTQPTPYRPPVGSKAVKPRNSFY